MTFNKLTDLIDQEHQDNYYELLLAHSSLILTELGRTSKAQVATALNIHPTVFSTALKYIIAHHNLVNKAK